MKLYDVRLAAGLFTGVTAMLLAACVTHSGLSSVEYASRSQKLDPDRIGPPGTGIEYRLSPLDVLTFDVHPRAGKEQVADFGNAVDLVLAMSGARYKLAPGDSLSLSLQAEGEQRFSVSVRPDGYLTLPRIGVELHAAGLTIMEVNRDAAAQYRALSQRPQISIELIKSSSEVVAELSGAYVVDGSGSILMPTLGSIDVAGADARTIAAKVRSLVQARYLNEVEVSASIDPYPKSSSPLPAPAEARRYFRETARISPDGSVFLPVAGRIQAAGKTLEALDAEVVEILRPRYRIDVDVYLGLGESAALNVYVMGEVRTPGRLGYTPSMSLLQAIASAGGVNDGGDLGKVRLVHRTGPASAVVYTSNLKEVLSGKGKGSQDLRVSPSDLIVVARTAIANLDLITDQYIRRLIPTGTSVNYSYIDGNSNSNSTAVQGVSR